MPGRGRTSQCSLSFRIADADAADDDAAAAADADAGLEQNNNVGIRPCDEVERSASGWYRWRSGSRAIDVGEVLRGDPFALALRHDRRVLI